MNEQWMNATEYARKLGVSRSAVIRWMKEEMIQFSSLGGAKRILSTTPRPKKRRPWHKERELRVSMSK